MRHTILAAAIFTSLGAALPAQSTSADSSANARKLQAPPPNALPDTMSSYDFLLGTWQCNGLTPKGQIDHTFSQDNSKILNGAWLKFHAVSSHGDDDAFATYDRKGHVWRYLSIDESGGYSIGSAPGWIGNTQTWTGYLYSNGKRRSWGRITFTKVSDRDKREDFYAPGKNGSRRFVGSEVCTKTG